MSHRNTHNSPKKRKSPPISTFSPLHPKAQQNRHFRHPQNTLPHLQKAPQVKQRQSDKKRDQPPHFSRNLHFSVSPQKNNKTARNIQQNRRRSDPIHPHRAPQLKQSEKIRRFPIKHRKITPYTSTTMDWEKIRNLMLEVKDGMEEQRKNYKKIGEIIGEMKADVKAQVAHTPSTPSPIALQPSYSSVSTQTTPHAVPQPSYTSISTQTEPLTEIVEIATPVSTSLPVTRSPPPTSVLAPILPPPSSLLPIIPTILVSPPISESRSGSTTLSRPQPSPNRLDTLRPRPYPTSQLRPQPEPPPGDGPMSRVHRGRRIVLPRLGIGLLNKMALVSSINFIKF